MTVRCTVCKTIGKKVRVRHTYILENPHMYCSHTQVIKQTIALATVKNSKDKSLKIRSFQNLNKQNQSVEHQACFLASHKLTRKLPLHIKPT